MILNLTCDVERSSVTQTATGHTKYDVSDPLIVVADLVCAIQNASPQESDIFERRGLSISTVVYHHTLDTGVQLGDRVKDARYSPAKYYTVVAMSDMGGRGRWFKIYCQEVQ